MLIVRVWRCLILLMSLTCISPCFAQTYDYTARLKRFTSTDYNADNAAALDEMSLLVSQASGANDVNLPPPKGFDLSLPIVGIDPIRQVPIIFAYIFVSHKKNMVVLSFTATENLLELISDIIFVQVPAFALTNFELGVAVEKGFYDIYLAVQQQIRYVLQDLIKKRTQFVITGHSLGGALATLAAFDLTAYKPIVYTFASPRVGNVNFARIFNTNKVLQHTWRVFNTEDIVPALPPPEIPLNIFLPTLFVFEHIGNPAPFTLNLGTILGNHIEAYKFVIINQNPPDNPPFAICPNAECQYSSD